MRIERLNRPRTAAYWQPAIENFLRLTPDLLNEAMALADSAAIELEEYCAIALFDQPIQVTLDAWPDQAWFSLPITPYRAGSLLTVTINGAAVTDFTIISGQRPALSLAEIPASGPIVITYTAGFGAELGAIPADLRHAILDQAAVSFDLRGEGNPKNNGMSVHMARCGARYRRVAI